MIWHQKLSKGDNTLSHDELVELSFKRAKPYLNEIDAFADGQRIDLASEFKKILKILKSLTFVCLVMTTVKLSELLTRRKECKHYSS